MFVILVCFVAVCYVSVDMCRCCSLLCLPCCVAAFCERVLFTCVCDHVCLGTSFALQAGTKLVDE